MIIFPCRPCGAAALLRFLYAVAEKGREDDRGADNEQARADKCHDGLGDVVVAPGHLDVDLERGNDDENRGDGVADVQDIQHHRHHEIVHRGQSIRTPAVIHAPAFGKYRVGEDGTERT